MDNEVYLVGDDQRLVIKNLIKDLNDIDIEVHVLKPESHELTNLPRTPFHLILCVSSLLDINIIREIEVKRKKIGFFLYIVGHNSELTEKDDLFLRKLPGFHFPSLPLDLRTLSEAIEYNDRTKKRVLVVDDEPLMLRSVNIWLGDDFEVSLVNSGEMAIEFLNRHPVDLVLLDYRMPTMNGPQVLSKIRNDEVIKKTPVMFLTGKADREGVMEVMHLKPEGYILKSKSSDEIKDAVKDFFKNRVITIGE